MTGSSVGYRSLPRHRTYIEEIPVFGAVTNISLVPVPEVYYFLTYFIYLYLKMLIIYIKKSFNKENSNDNTQTN